MMIDAECGGHLKKQYSEKMLAELLNIYYGDINDYFVMDFETEPCIVMN